MKRTAIKQSTKPMTRKKRLGKKSQAPHAIQRRICLLLWGTIIILRDKWCQYHLPVKIPANHPHHVFPKGKCPATQYDTRVGIGLCGGCHEFEVPDPIWHPVNVRLLGGQDAYDRLEALSHVRMSKPDLKLIELMLWQDLAEYGVYKPDLWVTWKEWKKEKFLRERRSHER